MKFNKSLTAIAVAVSFGVATNVYAASNTAGSIYGKADAGSQITYKNKNTGVSRTITVSEDGRFNIGSVPAGNYVVTDAEGNTREITVVIGTGTSVIFDDTEVIQVTGTRVSSIDTSSVESTSVYLADDIIKLPVARNSVAVALLTPGAVQGGANFGRNLPSFGGSSIAENGYYIDGMDVTNLRNMLQFANLPQDAINQTQVKSGGYGVEYGRSLGGIINIVTKSGTNDWEFGGSAYWRPDSLRADTKDIYNKHLEDQSVYNSDDAHESLAYNVYAGGALIEDSLFFFANLEGQYNEWDNYSRWDSYNSKTTTPNYLVKLDWYINEDHLLRFTHINNETEYDRTNYDSYINDEWVEWSSEHGEVSSEYTYESGGEINVLAYTGYLTENLSVNLMYGTLEHKYLKVPNLSGDDCPYAWDSTGGVGWGGRTAIGCWNAPVQALVTDQVDDKDERTSYKIDFEWVLGDHTLRFGYNDELYESTSPGVKYSGDAYYRYITADTDENGCYVNGVLLPCDTETVRIRKYNTQTATFAVENTAWYIEDSWQVTDNVLIYGGLRGETFTNKDGNGDIFLESDNLIAPRIGFSWDIDGDSSKKLYGTLGRYYIPVAANTNIRATREETYFQNFYYAPDGWNTSDGSPISVGDEIGFGVTDIQVPNPEIISDHNLEPMHQDELILGYQQNLTEDWSAGVKFMGRTIRDGMDDFCANDGFTRWAADNGYDSFDPHSLAGCIIVNPGNDITISMDLNNDGNYVATTTPAEYHGLPEYKRHYLGLEFTAEKALSDKWKANFSYVLSRTFGNAEGYVNSSLGQEDAGATQDFDHANFMHGAYGDLPTDRTHQFKVYGLYEVTDEFAMSFNFSAVSGIPLSCQGYVSTDGMLVGDGSTSYDYGNFYRYSASSFYCVNDDGEPELSNRGDYGRSNWLFNTDLSAIYAPGWAEGLTLQATVFNVFDTQRPDTYDQQKDLDRGNPNTNGNFLNATGYQPARYVQFSARYAF